MLLVPSGAILYDNRTQKSIFTVPLPNSPQFSGNETYKKY
jgi:hypothetical protein